MTSAAQGNNRMDRKIILDYATVQSMIATAIANERQLIAAALARLLAEERQEAMSATRDELHMLKIEIANLRNEAATLREALALERSSRSVPDAAISRRVN
jgi:hypothetical protein